MGTVHSDTPAGLSPPDPSVEVTLSRAAPPITNDYSATSPENPLDVAAIKSDNHLPADESDFPGGSDQFWQHGVRVPYTAFKYYKVNNISTKTRLNKSNDKGVFAPRLVIAPVDHAALGTRDPLEEQKPPPFHPDNSVDNLYKADINESIFSGWFSIPRVSLNVPTYAELENAPANFDTIPQLCYQNHFDVEDLTFSFGGLFMNKNSTFDHLGLPKDVDLEKISIYFPCELPPFISKEILTSPFLCQNRNFFMFNPKRGSSTYIDTLDSKDSPGHINSLISTQISDRHIFFYGGFLITDESIKYDAKSDRWIIRKKMILNEDGYVLDKLTFTFSKVVLKAKGASFKNEGRLGSSIVSNIYQRHESLGEPTRAHLPLIFTESTSSKSNPTSPYMKPSTSPKYNQDTKLADSNTTFASVPAITASHSYKEGSENVSAVSSISSVLHSKTKQTPVQKMAIHAPNIRTAIDNSPTKSSSGTGVSLKAVSTNSSSNSGDVSSVGISESSGSLNNSPTIATKTSKMSNVLSKSSRIFHRSHHQRQLSGSTPKSPQPHPHTLKNTYSKQVKQHRSNSQHSSNESRPVSPIQLLQKSKQDSHLKVEPKSEPKSELKLESKLEPKVEFLQTITTPPDSRSATPVSFEKVPSKSHLSYEATKQRQQENKIPEISSDATSEDEQHRKHILFHESILKTGINGVTIFIFGGFRPVTHDDGHLSFIASDELLKIDLASKDHGAEYSFHDEAIMFDISDSCRSMATKPDTWPSPRGFFAYSLVNYNDRHDHCTNDIFHDSDIDSIMSKRATSPMSSSSGASFQTISSGQENKLAIQGPDSFFNGKALLVQGGCNEAGETFSGLHLFLFDTGQWQTLNTYCYDYFEFQIQPSEDESNSRLTKQSEVQEAKLIEAELRSCHHTALYYQREGRDYLFFMGGFRNDFLRHFDKTPYQSDKFDVTRLSKFSFVSDNSNTSRIPVLNLQTQTWRFLKYYHDVRHIFTDDYVERINHNDLWLNARIASYGGSISLNGKCITLCHGLIVPCPAKKEDYEKMEEEIPTKLLLWGGHVHFSFPDL